jgi:predicted transcriptional regulator
MRSPDKVRMTLDLSPELDKSLGEIAESQRISKSDVLRRALALVLVAKEAKSEGRALGIIDRKKNTVVREIVGL